MNLWNVLGAACVAASVSLACATPPPPKDRLAWALAEVRESELAGAELDSVANAELERAKHEIRVARALSSKGDNDEAESMLRRSAVDAELARALAREARVRSAEVTQ